MCGFIIKILMLILAKALLIDDVKNSSILKNGVGIEGQKSTQTSKKYVCM